MAGGFMIAALSFAFGAILFWSPASSQSASGSAAQATAGGQVASADGAEEGDSGLVGAAGRKASVQYDSSVYIMKNKAGDLLGDSAVDATKEAVEPGVEAASHAVASVLPSSIAHYVPWLAGAALYKAEGNAKESLGNVVEDNFEAAAMAVKPGGDGSDGGNAPAASGSSASAGRVATGGAGAPSAVSGSVPGTGGAVAGGMVTPAAWGGERWTIRLGRFATAANADTFAGELSRRGVPARVAVASDGGRYWSFVQSGSYEGRGAAEMALRDLQARGYGGSVVSEGGSGF
ncbi:SPOR domain-containing protein [Radicibacter daui]|uniref:SPOR domain-containing protein n=1 Tax=Radicibacter daui TaxID=3064829 RepID=UPI0040469358